LLGYKPERKASIAWTTRIPMLRTMNVLAKAEYIIHLPALRVMKRTGTYTVKAIEKVETSLQPVGVFGPHRHEDHRRNAYRR